MPENAIPGPSCLCEGQANIQAVLRPGVWLPGVRFPHQYQETWHVAANPTVCSQAVVEAVSNINQQDNKGKYYQINRVKVDNNSAFVRILCFTRMRWVDVVEMKITCELDKGSNIVVRSFSSGILPVWIPASFIFSCVMFIVPFYDKGRNAKWVKAIRDTLGIEVSVCSGGRKC
ncbi:uncharacterized protein LOC143230050 [Tachypleus tridentatus]|uniref:uncharacterized protein LOC143230050 n=1 Tax=Tachypleus tridentatus TaxID=6853 RepID=UPI003FD4821E